MSSANSILAVVAALVVSARTAPPNIGQGSFSYDPKSIGQNERILRLFLELASETADRLIRLKNDAEQRQREESAMHSEVHVPEFRMELTGNIADERIASSGYQGNSGRPRHPLDDRTVRHGQLSLDRYATGNGLADRVYGPYIPATGDSPIGGYYYRTNRGSDITGSRENSRSIDDSQESAEIQNRMMFDVQKNHDVNHNDDSRNTTNAQSLLGDQSSTAGEVISNLTMSEDSNHETRSDGMTSAVGSSWEDQSSTTGAVILNQTMNEDSNQETRSDEMTTAVGSSLGVQSSTAGAVISTQIMSEDANHESRSDGMTSAVGNSLGNQSSTAGAVVSSQTVSDDPNHEIRLDGISAVGSPSGDQTSTAAPVIIHQTMTAPSNIQSASVGLISSIQSGGLGSQNLGEGRIDDETVAAGSVIQSSSSGQLAAVQAGGSKTLVETVAAGSGNQASQMVSSIAGDQGHQAIANGVVVLDSNKSEGILSNANLPTILANQGSPAGNTGETISVMKNVATGMLDAGARITNSGGLDVSRKTPNLAMMSVARGQTKQVGQVLKGFNGAGSKFTGSLVDVPTKIARDSLTGHENGITVRTFADQHAKGDWDGGVSELELNKYANQFADALRPVRMKRRLR